MSSHADLAQIIGKDVEGVLLEVLPELVEAVRRNARQASATFTFQVERAEKGKGPNKRTVTTASLRPRVRAPMEAIDYEVAIDDSGQLGLFAGDGEEGR